MTQVTLSRTWVVVAGFMIFTVGLGYGLFALWQNAPRLLARANAAIVEVPPLRGAIEAADGTPIAMSTSEEVRIHPLGPSMAQVIGFGERSNGKGLSGLERDLQLTLSNSKNVRLTLDPVYQSLAEQALWRGLEAARADWGSVVLMEAKTGRLLAVANGPKFDPSAPRGDPSKDISWRNHAFLTPIEPGSTMKALTAATLIEEKAATLSSKVYAPMRRIVGGRQISDVVQHPETLTLAEVLRYSSNVGISRLAERLPKSTLYNYMQRLGFLNAKPIPSIETGKTTVRTPDKWGPVEAANAAFGQGFLITPLHLAAAFNTLANNGVYRSPILLEGQVSKAYPVFRPQTAQDIRSALTQGAVPSARIPGYALGGKTGTAQVVINGRYSRDVFTALFAGFIPSDTPRVTAVVTLYNPKGSRINGSQISAPIYREIAAGLLAYWGVVPQLDNAQAKGKLENR